MQTNNLSVTSPSLYPLGHNCQIVRHDWWHIPLQYNAVNSRCLIFLKSPKTRVKHTSIPSPPWLGLHSSGSCCVAHCKYCHMFTVFQFSGPQYAPMTPECLKSKPSTPHSASFMIICVLLNLSGPRNCWSSAAHMQTASYWSMTTSFLTWDVKSKNWHSWYAIYKDRLDHKRRYLAACHTGSVGLCAWMFLDGMCLGLCLWTSWLEWVRLCVCGGSCLARPVWLHMGGQTHTHKQQLTHPPCCLIQAEMFSLINCKTQLMILLIMSKWFWVRA